MPDSPERQTTADLLALAAAAHGNVAARSVSLPVCESPVIAIPVDEARQKRIAELKAKYQSGELKVDENALVSRLVDMLFENRPPADPDARVPNDKT